MYELVIEWVRTITLKLLIVGVEEWDRAGFSKRVLYGTGLLIVGKIEYFLILYAVKGQFEVGYLLEEHYIALLYI